jgi:hypothetical protein
MLRIPFPLDTSATAYQHSARILELLPFLREQTHILFQICGHGAMHPADALLYLDLLALEARPTQTFEVISYCHVIGAGDAALFLGAGQTRDVRPSATLYVPSEPPIYDLRCYYAHTLRWDVAMEMMHRDYDACLKRIGEHVSLDLVLDQHLDRDDLRELLLIDSPELDCLLAKTQAGVPPQLPINLTTDDEDPNVLFFTDDDVPNDGEES